jgi:WLM domain
MYNTNECIIVFIIIVALMLIYFYTPPRIEIDVQGRAWSVIESYENSTEAAEMLSRLHERMLTFMRYLKFKYHIDETEDVIAQEGAAHNVGSQDVQKILHALLDNYNPDVFYENDPRYSNDTSYTINKGDSMYICLRKKDQPATLEDEELVFFVMIHECAHIGNYNGWGHDDRFWTVFKFLLHEAVLAGVYHPIDYEKYPADYCGLKVYYQPLNDRGLPNLWE